MKSKCNITGKDISRRTFLYGGAALVAAGGLGLNACGLKEATDSSDAKIKATLAYASTNYDPVGQFDPLMLAVNWHIYEGLYELDMHSYDAYPGLAADWPEKIDDLTYKIKLRDKAKFSNGTYVTVDDVIASIGANISSSGYKAYLNFIKSCERGSSSNELILHLNYPYDSLLCKRLSIIKIYQSGSTDYGDSARLKLGTGPWYVKEIEGADGGHITFMPNINYNGRNKVPKDKMYWKILLDSDARTNSIIEKKSYVIENVPDGSVDKVKDSWAEVVYDQGFDMSLFIFNTLNEKFIDKRARQALYYAINTQKLINDKLNGQGSPAQCLLPRGSKNFHKASTIYTYDPEKAKQLLKETGNENMEIELWVNNTWTKELASSIQEDLEAVGIKCNLRKEAVNWNKLKESDEVLPFDVILTSGDPSVFGDDPDLLMNFWHGDNIWNWGRSCWAKNPNSRFEELQNLLYDARAASGEEQQKIWNQCLDLVADQVSIYPILHKDIATGFIANKLNNYQPIQSTGLNFINVSSV